MRLYPSHVTATSLCALLALSVTVPGQVPAATPQTSDAATQAALFDRIRAAYYHPGKIALACDATLDLTAALEKIGDPESAKALDGLKLRVTASDSKYADVTFTWPAAFPEESRMQVEGSAKQVVGGFFQAYWPIANAEILPAAKDNPTVVGAAAGGYTITADTGATSSRLSVDADGLIRRVENHPTPGQTATLTLSYSPSPNPRPGDRMRFTGLDVDRAIAGGMRIRAAMKWDEQDVSGVFIPHRVVVGIPGAFDVPVTLSGCSVSPDPAVVAPPR